MILVNLTCGRNPWKKAAAEDSTFRAFLKDSTFLSSILPISEELNMILQRIFECNPRQRIGLDELRDLIVSCPSFTTTGYNTMPPTPPQSPYEYVDAMDCANLALPPSPPRSPCPGTGYHGQPSEWFPAKQTSSCSTNSSDSGYESENSYLEASPQPINFYGNMIPIPDHDKMAYYQTTFGPTSIATY